jgi:hypothetical protein
MQGRSGTHKRILSELDFYVLNTKDPGSHEIELVERAFAFWRRSWEETFRTLKVIDDDHRLYADDFLDREAMALFAGDEPVALFFGHLVSLRESQRNHSYFKNYPPRIFESLKQLGFSRAFVLSYMTVLPDYRKSLTDVPMYELLFSLGVKRFRTVPHECLLGYIRKDLSFHKTFDRHGGIHLAQNHVYNVDVEYFYMTKASARLSPLPHVAETTNILWEKMLFRDRTVANRGLKKAA